MGSIFITGSTDGLGLAAARSLIADGHDVVHWGGVAGSREATLLRRAARGAKLQTGTMLRAASSRRRERSMPATSQMEIS